MRPAQRNPILLVASVVFLALAGRVCAQTFQPFQGEVTSDGINIRTDSTISSETILSLSKGSRVDVAAELYDWYKVRLPGNAPSYIRKDLLECTNYNTVVSTDPKIPQIKHCISAKLLKDNVNIRMQPNTTSAILGKAAKDEAVSVVADAGEWYKIIPTSATYGWINKQFVVKSSSVKYTQPVNVAQDNLLSKEEGVVLIGAITSYNRLFKRAVSHKLVTADNQTFLLKGEKKLLDPFLQQKAKITGKRVENANEKFPVIEVISVEAAQ